jgi:hypothetical protein
VLLCASGVIGFHLLSIELLPRGLNPRDGVTCVSIGPTRIDEAHASDTTRIGRWLRPYSIATPESHLSPRVIGVRPGCVAIPTLRYFPGQLVQIDHQPLFNHLTVELEGLVRLVFGRINECSVR